ncbi:hypothetical protein ABK040_004268 [Willaertia magna]
MSSYSSSFPTLSTSMTGSVSNSPLNYHRRESNASLSNNNNNVTTTTIRIALVGSSNTGKHALASYFTNGYFVSDMSTKSRTTFTKHLKHQHKELILQLSVVSDIAASQLNNSDCCYSENIIDNDIIFTADIILFLYDITDLNSLEMIIEYYNYFHCNDNLFLQKEFQKYIIGTKIDLEDERQVNQKHVDELKEKLIEYYNLNNNNGIQYYECSCMTGENVNGILEDVIQKHLTKFKLNNNNKSSYSSSLASLSERFRRFSLKPPLSSSSPSTNNSPLKSTSAVGYNNSPHKPTNSHDSNASGGSSGKDRIDSPHEYKEFLETFKNQFVEEDTTIVNNNNVNHIIEEKKGRKKKSQDSKLAMFTKWFKKRSSSAPVPYNNTK